MAVRPGIACWRRPIGADYVYRRESNRLQGRLCWQGGTEQVSKAGRNRDVARAKVAEMRAREARQARQRRLFIGIGAAVLAIIAAVAIAFAVTSGGGKPTPPTSAPKLKLGPPTALGPLKPAPSAGPPGFGSAPTPAAPTLARPSAPPTVRQA